MNLRPEVYKRSHVHPKLRGANRADDWKAPRAGSDRKLKVARDFVFELRKNVFMPKSRLVAFLIKELREIVPPTVFFAVGFNLILLTTKLLLADYRVHFANFMVATMTALVVGKAVV